MRHAFKEWAIVVDALGRGDQILILRKGGIAEGRDGFRVDHQNFLLFPTLYHQQRECVTPGGQVRFDEIQASWPPPTRVRVEYVASAAGWWKVGSLHDARQLREQHIWRDEVIEQRFSWGREEAIYVLALRVARLKEPREMPLLPTYGGCKSWVQLAEDVPVGGARPVLSDGAFARKMGDLIRRLEPVGTRVVS
jgi:hypothetical protein